MIVSTVEAVCLNVPWQIHLCTSPTKGDHLFRPKEMTFLRLTLTQRHGEIRDYSLVKHNFYVNKSREEKD